MDEYCIPSHIFAMEIRRHVGRKVAGLRQERGLSQEDLSFQSGFHRTYISQVERGAINPTIESLKRLADSLEVPCHKLIEPL